MKQHSKSILILILAPFVFSFAFGLDIYVPIVPEMQRVFHTTPFMVQLTLSLFLLITGVGQLIIGPLSDQFGRYRIIALSAVLFIIGSILSASSVDIGMLIIARMICALGACGLLVVSFAIIRDLYSGNDSAQMYSFINGAIGISPTFAPVIGGYLAVAWGWQAVFWFLATLGVLVLFTTCFFITETLPYERRQKVGHNIWQRYWTVFCNKHFLVYGTFAGLGVTIFFSFFSVSSFVIIDLLHVPVQNFGYYFAVFGLVILTGGFVTGWTVVRLGINKTIFYGVILALLGGLLMLITNLFWGLHLATFLIATAIACYGAAFIDGAAAAGVMEPFPHIAGTAAAALGAIQFGISALIGTVLMHWSVTSSISYAICIISVAVVGLLLSICLKQRMFQSKVT